MNVLYSKTAIQSGFGSALWKRVTFLTKEEKEFIKKGGIVVYKTNCLDGGNHGSYWRQVKYEKRYNRYYPQTTTREIVELSGQSWEPNKTKGFVDEINAQDQ